MTFKDIAQKSIAVNCHTEDEAKKFIKMANESGYQWEYKNPEKLFYEHYGGTTAYIIRDSKVIMGDWMQFLWDGYKIISFSSFIKEPNVPIQNVKRANKVITREETDPMDIEETVDKVQNKLSALMDIVMALSSSVEHGGVTSCECLEHIAEVIYDCKQQLGNAEGTKE